MGGKIAHPEALLQREIVTALHAVLLPPAFLTAIPAGGGGALRGAILKGMGYCAGVPDLMLVAGKAYFLEIKCRTGKVSSAQHDTMSALERAGADCAVVRSVDKALAMVLFWGIPNRIAGNERERLLRIGGGT